MNKPIRKIKVTTPNRMIPVKGNLVRTPVTIDIYTEAEFNFIELYLRKECAEFEIIEDTIDDKNTYEEVEIIDQDLLSEDDEPIIEELDSNRILDNILKD